MVISFTNRKGDVGKTSCAGNIAHEIPQSSYVGESQMKHLPLARYNAGEDRALPAYRVIAEKLLEVREYATV